MKMKSPLALIVRQTKLEIYVYKTCPDMLLIQKDISHMPITESGNDSESVWVKVFANKISHFVASSLVGSEQYIRPDVSICIVRKSLSLVMTLKMVNAFYLSIQFFGHKQPGKCVLFKFVFHIDHHRAHLDVVFYALNLFFHLQITSVCKKHTSPVNKKQTN